MDKCSYRCSRFLLIFTCFCFVQSYYISFDNDIDECKSLCSDSFYLLPLDRQAQLDCQRGCRFFILIDLKNDHQLNSTKEECLDSCQESYVNVQERKSCITGCDIVMKKKETVSLKLIPFFDQSNILLKDSDFELELLDPTIRKHLDRKSYLNYHIPQEYIRTMPIEQYDALISKTKAFSFEEKVGDWLECASKNSGIPRWLLIFAIFIAIFAVILLSFSSDRVEYENEANRKASDLSLLIEKEPETHSEVVKSSNKNQDKEVEFTKPPEYYNTNTKV